MARRVRLPRAQIAYLHDVFMAGVSFVLSLYLRVGDSFAWYADELLLLGTVLFAAVAAVVFASMKLYRGVWRYASLDDMTAIAKAASLVILIFLPLMFMLNRLEALPRSIVLINWFVLMALLGGPRILYRIFKDRRLDTVLTQDGRRRVPVLLVGAGDGAELFLRALNHQRHANYKVVGIVDDKGSRVGRQIRGVEIMGTIDDLPDVVERLARRRNRPHRLLIAKENLDGGRVRALLEYADRLGLTLSRVPDPTDFRSGLDEQLEVRPIAIEDLLGRPQAVLDRPAMKALIAGRRVMVTGAGGTIGSELVRQISDFGPARLSLLDNSEFQLYEIDMELAERHPDRARSALLADVRDQGRIEALMADEAPDLVFHAAALKHVPMVEKHPEEGVLTNVVGTRRVADACRNAGVAVMVLVSTDKAVDPTSVMGACKRLAEGYCQALDIAESEHEGGTRFVTVRFGNVLGSTGSVVPLFERQLARGGPLTVTHADATRFFMTVREAVELVLQASALGSGDTGYCGKIFVLDMGEPVRIQDLARQMIRLAGLRPDVDVKIVYTGLRPGEKLHEELLHESESLVPTKADGLLLAAPRTADRALLARAIDELAEAARAGRTDDLVSALHRLVPEYRQSGDAAYSTAATS